MADEPAEAGGGEGDSIRATDIVFDCPYCTKSLAIDYRGTGLTITCMDCGNNVIVPIPEGLDLSDLDSTDEEQEIRLVNLRRLLAAAEERADKLEARLAELGGGRDVLSGSKTTDHDTLSRILEGVRAIQHAQDETARLLRTMAGAARVA